MAVIAILVLIVIVAVGIAGFASYMMYAGQTTLTSATTSPPTSQAQSSTPAVVASSSASQSSSSGSSSSATGSSSTGTSTGVAAGALNSVQLYQQVSQSVVTVQGFVTSQVLTPSGPGTTVGEQLGSGSVITYNNANYVVTNFHVVDSASNITVVFSNGDAYPATVVGTDPYSDVAVVKVTGVAPSSEFHSLTFSSSASLMVGEPVVAVGNPFGLSGSMTEGIISQLGRTITEPAAGNYSIAGVIQFSAAINPGNSGGPLLNSDGLIVGMTTATVSGSQGLGFAIPSDTITKELPSLITTGKFNNHPYLGIGGRDMDYFLAQANGNNVTYGVLIENIVQGGPAQKAGIVAGNKQATVEGQNVLLGGDVIVSINGTRIVNYDALASYMETHTSPGQTVMMGVMRGTTLKMLPLVVGQRPPPA